jgi:hypothetical protein
MKIETSNLDTSAIAKRNFKLQPLKNAHSPVNAALILKPGKSLDLD